MLKKLFNKLYLVHELEIPLGKGIHGIKEIQWQTSSTI